MTTNDPLISIIIPHYNSSDLLKRTIKSALRQSYQAIEVIVVDDCSTDDTSSVVAKIQLQDPRVQLVHRVTLDLKEQLARKVLKELRVPKAPQVHRGPLDLKGQLVHKEMRELRDPLAHREFKGPQDLRVVLGHREQQALLAEQLFHIII